MINIDYYVDSKLRAWAAWSLKLLCGHLGAPSQSSFLNVLNGGPSTSSSVLYDDKYDDVERAMIQLQLYKPILARCIYIRYFQKNPREHVERYGLTYANYKKNLLTAKNFIAGALLGKYKYDVEAANDEKMLDTETPKV